VDRAPAAAGPTELDIPNVLIGLTLATAKRTMTGLRLGGDALRPLVGLALRPPLLPARLQPIAQLQSWGRTGAVYRLRAAPWLHKLVPAVADTVLDHLDLTSIILDRVNLGQIIDRIDLSEIIRESSATMASEATVGMRLRAMRADEGVSRIVDRVLQRHGVRNTQLRPLTGIGDDDQR
jgi:hypothetical protein